MQDRAPQFSFHLFGSQVGEHAIPVDVLVQVIENAQSAVELIGSYLEGRELRQRVKIPASLKEKYQLVCHIPVEGSYAVPLSLGNPRSEFFKQEDLDNAWNLFSRVVQGIGGRNVDEVKDSIRDSIFRRKLLECVKGMAPSPGSGWSVAIQKEDGVDLATFDSDTGSFVHSMLVPNDSIEDERVVIGELKSIDFAQKNFKFIYPPTKRDLSCTYDESLEDMLYENRRSYIQVTGRVVLDDNDQPKEIHEVSDIQNVDLSPFNIEYIKVNGKLFKANKLISLVPTLDEGKQYLILSKEDIGLDVYAQTRESLLKELNEQFIMLWDEYALADDSELDAKARKLKKSLLESFEEVSNAS